MHGDTFNRIDRAVTFWMAQNGLKLLRITIGLIFLWFGAMKFFPALSPAEGIASKTISTITFGLLSKQVALYILAAWETAIGLGLLLNLFLRETLLLMFVQMLGTITPIFLFPGEVFTNFPFGLTLEGQYIMKNLVLVSGGIVIGATVRGGRLVAE